MTKSTTEKPVSPISVANYLLEKGDKLVPLKLLKLVYLCHAYYLADTGKPLLTEHAQAWVQGPMIPGLYYATLGYANTPVHGPIDEGHNKNPPKPSGFQREVIDAIYDLFKDYEPSELSGVANKKGSPWHKVWKKEGRNAPIPNSLLQDYYKEFVNG